MSLPRTDTSACDAILRVDWPAGVHIDEVLVKVNATRPEGDPPYGTGSITHRLRTLGLCRPDWFISQQAVLAQERRRQRIAAGGTVTKRPKRNSVISSNSYSSGQEPLPPAKQLPVLKDGSLSPARLAIADELRQNKAVMCDRDCALTWGQRWCGGSTDLAVINTVRLEWHLPPFAVA